MFTIISFDLNSSCFLKDYKGRNGSHSSTQLCAVFVGESVFRGTRRKVRYYLGVINTSVNLEQTSGELKIVLYEGYAKTFHRL